MTRWNLSRGICLSSDACSFVPAPSRSAEQFDRLIVHVKIMEPAARLDMIQPETLAVLIATDSGEVQIDTFFHQVIGITLHDETEWTEPMQAVGIG